MSAPGFTLRSFRIRAHELTGKPAEPLRNLGVIAHRQRNACVERR